MAAAVAMELAKIRAHSEETRLEVVPNVLALVAMSVTGTGGGAGVFVPGNSGPSPSQMKTAAIEYPTK